MAQLELDWSVRGNQLRTLAKCVLPSVTHGARQTSGASLKAVLRGIDDGIGNKSHWDISVPKLCEQSGRSRAVVSAAIAALNRLSLIVVSENYRVVDGRAEQEAHTFRIVWSNLLDFVPVVPLPISKMREPQRIKIDRAPTPPTEVGSLSVRRGYAQSETRVVSVCDGGSLSLRLPPSQTETLTAPSCPSTADHPPPSARHRDGGRRRMSDLIFGAWLTDSVLRDAIRRRDGATLKRAFAELGDAAHWVAPVSQSDMLQVFAAMAFQAVSEAKSSPVGLLATRATRTELSRTSASIEALNWASAFLGIAPASASSSSFGKGHCHYCDDTPSPTPLGCVRCNRAKHLTGVAR